MACGVRVVTAVDFTVSFPSDRRDTAGDASVPSSSAAASTHKSAKPKRKIQTSGASKPPANDDDATVSGIWLDSELLEGGLTGKEIVTADRVVIDKLKALAAALQPDGSSDEALLEELRAIAAADTFTGADEGGEAGSAVATSDASTGSKRGAAVEQWLPNRSELTATAMANLLERDAALQASIDTATPGQVAEEAADVVRATVRDVFAVLLHHSHLVDVAAQHLREQGADATVPLDVVKTWKAAHRCVGAITHRGRVGCGSGGWGWFPALTD